MVYVSAYSQIKLTLVKHKKCKISSPGNLQPILLSWTEHYIMLAAGYEQEQGSTRRPGHSAQYRQFPS